MSILLEDNEILDAIDRVRSGFARNKLVSRAQAEKIVIELQAIYNLPDGGMFNKKLGEFIKELKDEVNE